MRLVKNIYKEIGQQHLEFFKAVSGLMFKHGPIEINTEEYDPEAGTVMPRLPAAKSEVDVLNILHQEFVVW